MNPEKKCAPDSPIKIYDASGDLSKRWFVYYFNLEGKRIKVYGGINRGKTKAERREIAEALLEEIHLYAEYKLIRHLRLYLESKRKTLRHRTYNSYSSRFNRFKSWYRGQTMNGLQAQAFLDYQVEVRGLGPTSVNMLRTFMSTAYIWMIKRGHEKENPFAGTEKLKANPEPARYFQPHQIKILQNVISKESPELWLFCQFLYYTFIRPAELRRLRIGDIVFSSQQIYIPSSKSKNKKSQHVAIPRAFWGVVQENFAHLPSHLYIFGKGGEPGEQQIGINYMGNIHRPILRRLGFSSDYKLYSWKHTGCVMAVRAGCSMKDLQIQLRHHSLDQVDQYIRQLNADDLGGFADRFPGI
ncbi:MAG: site-specific integrase [Bacteroidota bacterium]